MSVDHFDGQDFGLRVEASLVGLIYVDGKPTGMTGLPCYVTDYIDGLIRDARAEALEEAAVTAERAALHPSMTGWSPGVCSAVERVAWEMVAAIRAMKGGDA